MLDNWLSPIRNELLQSDQWEPYQIGSRIRIYRNEFPDLHDVQVALIGIGDRDADAVRQELYRLSFPFEGLTVADLGNIRRKSVPFMIAPIRELLDGRIFPLIIGADPLFTMVQYQAFHSLQQLISLVIVDERIRLHPSHADKKKYYLNQLTDVRKSGLFHLGFIGPQTHFADPEVLRYLEQQHYDCIRLGRAQADLSELEPIIRDGDLCSLNLAGLKRSEAPAVGEGSPSGFYLEEACQISRYAGMSDKLKSFGIFGYRNNLDQRNQTAQAVAQIIWYFLDGFFNRKHDFPAGTEGLVEYIVDFKKLEYQLTFWKSQKSGRWWMQVPVKTREQYQRHRLIPCSYNDYKLACQEELPDRLLHAFKRFT